MRYELIMDNNHSSGTKYSRFSLTQLCITQYYHLSRPDGPVPVFSPIYYCNSTTFISTTAKSIKLITRYEKLVMLINFSVFYNAQLDSIILEITLLSECVSNFPPLSKLIIPIKTTNCLITYSTCVTHAVVN